MREFLKKIRYKLAYLIAPDWIDDLEERLSLFLWHQTGGKLSKPYYTIQEMNAAANDYIESLCDDCGGNI